MELIRGLHNLRDQHRGCVATIGNFDGVHLGHHRVLDQVREKAAALGLPSVAIVFEPQPREFFEGPKAPPRLTRFRDKFELIRAHGIDRVFCLHFNQSLRSLTAEQFIDRLLLSGLAVKYFVVGDDFRFGCDRAGDFALLQHYGNSHDFTVVNTRTHLIDDERVSSTRIRQALAEHRFELAGRLLGRPYQVSGKVIHGRKLGRQLGLPTANISLQRKRLAFDGVYIVDALTEDGQRLAGVANVGVRPTVNGDHPLLEVHLLDFSGRLYGQRLQVEFLAHVRPEQKFDGVEALKQQILDDIAFARSWREGRD
ncbi:bifunctional riboflavin kinase/FAD synthetase [Motiliproteus coralliicola]|uniref:Riboflavin biosynthesis protein n=1 Tax=Motiliproteus coralliicola TaxID=2283196 RepID=A0A369WB15_9GAMM|nr:bifunctional riboflavin kinase/FAD synthetase [Motiliproteus coralliicola]RDE18491.1 bifunctional riboflavin kinase/FAD synthetase [Motiliproteus coralliicola]